MKEGGPQIERGMVFLRDTCHFFFFTETVVTSGSPREACFDLGDVKVEKDIVTFSEKEDEDTLVEEGPQIERGTVSPRDTRHCETHPKSIRDKRIPREAFFDLGDVKVENVIVTFHD